MSDQEQIRNMRAAVLGIIKSNQNNPHPFFPSSAIVIKAITSQPYWIEEPEDSTVEDWDAEVHQAACDLLCKPQRFYPHPNDPKKLERPEDRLRRIGNRDGKKSPFYQELLAATADGRDLPHTTDRTFEAMQRRFDIVNAYRDYLTKRPDLTNYMKAKNKAYKHIQTTMLQQPSAAAIDDALRDFDMNWPAYIIAAPRKGRRKT